MHRMLIGGALAAICFAAPAVGQNDFGNQDGGQADAIVPTIEPVLREPMLQDPIQAPTQPEVRNQQPEQVTMTAEAYRAMQYKPSPRELVYRRAAMQGAQRRARIASREWYGVSLARPRANPLPHMGTYSAYWANNYRDPYIWLENFYYDGYYQNYRDVQVYRGGIR